MFQLTLAGKQVCNGYYMLESIQVAFSFFKIISNFYLAVLGLSGGMQNL